MEPILITSKETPSFIDLVVCPNNEQEAIKWIKGKDDIFIPSNLTEFHDSLPPGQYSITYNTREGYPEYSKIECNTDELYALPDSQHAELIKEINSFWQQKDLYKQANLLYRRGILLTGPPGCGKTACIKQAAADIIKNGGVVFSIKTIQQLNVTFDSLSKEFAQIEKDRSCIIIIEDIDQIIDNLGGDNMLLEYLDGQETLTNTLIIFTSNDPTNLSKALLRPSRIDSVYEFPYPSQQVREEYFKCKNIENYKEFAYQTDGLSLADLKEVFIGTQINRKPLLEVVSRIRHGIQLKNYLEPNKLNLLDE